MMDYEALDISAWCNADTGILSDENPLLGEQTFRGLPFIVGSADANSSQAYISLRENNESVTVPVGKTARRVIFAHRQLETEQPNNGPVGVTVAEYIVHLNGGETVTIPVRERYEISPVGDRGGISRFGIGYPYLAVPDQEDTLMPRYEGKFELAGRRQTEATQALPNWYWLWAWVNPQPEREIESIEFVPRGPRFIVAGVTLGHIDEHPFSREARRPVRVSMKHAADAEKPFDLDVTIDRGERTYVHALPEQSSDEFLNHTHKGIGEPQNEKSSPAYLELSGIPSATVEVSHAGEKIDSVSWGDVQRDGSAETDKVKIELVEPGKNWVNITVVDDDTGKPVPCRVHFRSPEGIPYQPHGHHNQVNSNLDTWHVDVGGDLRFGQITYAYIDGTAQGWLPRGEAIVDVARGYEYEPLRAKINIEPGQRDLELRLKRWINMNERGWYSGDSHVHFLSTQGSHFESQGEDLNVVNLLQSQWGGLFTNVEDFTGEPSVTQDGNNIVYTSQENRQHFMGHMILWGLKKPVMPFCSDGLSESEIAGPMETTLAHWADEAHAQGGYVINPHFPHPNGQPAALIATGRLDGVEMIMQKEYWHGEWYRYLNCGYRLPLIGGTDKMSSDVAVGMYRTYVNIPDDEEFTYENWCRNVAKGRTMLSGGPIIHFTVDGREVGDTINLSSSGTVEVSAWAESVVPMSRLEIVQEGRVVASTESASPTRRLEISEKIKISGNSWLAARAGGPDYYGYNYYDQWQRGIFAHTSPIYVAVGGPWHMFDEATAQYMLTLIHGATTYIDNSSRQHTHGHVNHHHGEDDHLAYLKRPFVEAQEAVELRLREHGYSV
jgi:hypothetical protein